MSEHGGAIQREQFDWRSPVAAQLRVCEGGAQVYGPVGVVQTHGTVQAQRLRLREVAPAVLFEVIGVAVKPQASVVGAGLDRCSEAAKRPVVQLDLRTLVAEPVLH